MSDKKRGRPRSLAGGAHKINVYMSEPMLKKLEEIQKELGFSNQSEFNRFIINNFIDKVFPNLPIEIIKEMNKMKS